MKTLLEKLVVFQKFQQLAAQKIESRATSLHPIGSAFTYIETSSNNLGHERVFVSWKRTFIIQITNRTSCYNRYSILTNILLKSTGRFRFQLLLADITWSTQHNIPKIDQ